jgi:peroxiredoxin
VTLSELRGRNVLLAFFPAAFTRVCTDELCAFSEDFDQFSGAGTVVLPISVDNVPSLRAFKSKEGMQVELLSDLRREASRSFGVLDEERFVAKRAYVLIDRAGVVRWHFIEETPGTKRDNAELLRRIEALN